ncbi:type IV pilus biogenesis/stability protein PilW [Colwellia asteriadis]|uniref:type IV pilus biogenesis/stability protein PilW n=1 Tax=Colwellia asteriadis TaxID=517723 RepID=UPI0031D35B1E
MSKIGILTKNIWPKCVPLLSAFILSACVTQSYENNTPVVENSASKNEMAATRISLGLGYLNMGNMTQAKMNLEKAKRFAPDLVQVYTAFAHYYETVGENELTVQSYEKALSLAPNDADTLNNYGVFLCRQDKVHEAETQLLKAIAVPSYLLVAQSYENLASCYLQIDDFTKAEQYLNKAIAHSPNRTATLLQMVRLQYAMNNYEQAKVYQQKFERNTHRFSPDSLALAYKVYWQLGQRKTAQNYANMLVRMYPQSWESKQYLLNELQQIEADLLAQRYQLTQRNNEQELPVSDGKKRIVKLSPKKPRSQTLITNKQATSAALTASVVSPSSNEEQYLADNKVEKGLDEQAESTESDTIASVNETPIEKNAAEKIVTTPADTTSDKGVNNAASSANKLVVADPIDDEKAGVEPIVETQVAEKTVLEEANNDSTLMVSADIDSMKAENSATFTKPVPAKRDTPLPVVTDYVEESNTSTADTTSQITSAIPKGDNPTKEVTESVISEPVVEQAVIDTPKTNKATRHTVKKGETLYAISVKYNVKLQALRAWNNMSEKQNLHVGKNLYVVNPETVNINE